jgi:hypothetical protein
VLGSVPGVSVAPHRLCENSKTPFRDFEKVVVEPLATNKNAPYRICGSRFFGSRADERVFTQSAQFVET